MRGNNLKSKNTDPFVVRRPKFRMTKLVDQENQFHPQINVEKAIRMAQDVGLSLVCFNAPNGSKELPLCKIIDFGKWKYDNEKKRKKASKANRQVTKELRFSFDISEHDIEHKIRQAKDFFEDGDEVVFSMFLKGRQRLYIRDAEEKMNQIVNLCEGYGKEISRRRTDKMITIRMAKGKDLKQG